MSGRKKQPSQLLRLSEVHKGHIKEMVDQKYYMYKGNPVVRVRIFGIVIDKFDSAGGQKRRFINLRVDDGSDTIQITTWSYPRVEDGEVKYDPIHMVEDVEIGDIIDVNGRVREYNDELFINPYSVSVKEDGTEWEIYRRTQMVQNDLQNTSLLDEGVLRLPDDTPDLPEVSEELSEEQRIEELSNKILKLMKSNDENTVEVLTDLTGESKEDVEQAILNLRTDALIFEKLPGRYEIV